MHQTLLRQFRDPELCHTLLTRLRAELDGELRFMEVCGTHTVAIFQSGLRSLLPPQVVHLSGPGCPVCVTHESEVNAFLDLAGRPGVIVATFGDLMRVPGSRGRNLKSAQAEGARVAVVYSPPDALALARDNPGDTVVFLGVGFETTAPTVAGTVLMAREQGLSNFKVLAFHKLVPPALEVLLSDTEAGIDAFILPGHVSAVIGTEPYGFIASRFGKSATVTGFEPVDILESLLFLAQRRRQGRAEVKNLYRRVVSDTSNPRALEVMNRVFRPCDALWRGLGRIPDSGLEFTDEFEDVDAKRRYGLSIEECPPLPGCKCGEVLRGRLRPDQCPLFKKACTPAKPVGPCMVSTEGSCAAYYKYQVE
ncbi:hydrogenase formation protein HypD [Desulfovibrio sulfodismutans]|uniref:Hydrogenase formation protein HypD n=1 Tax=Desulfolutivibrio sulfodismutans TaxID=63561 RepID=A0A7K3NL65_9BACT|nr:hydrogenase formation protein HypD [Desulfolutivibrio sulfodismutans]NDY56922.1 hydrogenase formation protein HypD [Desulfolutivibrio sulfodismutans]QLA12945.1 hydrogenase formation protein HypD [Desulfolutivibrio sulfodismutans DSM 3696]